MKCADLHLGNWDLILVEKRLDVLKLLRNIYMLELLRH